MENWVFLEHRDCSVCPDGTDFYLVINNNKAYLEASGCGGSSGDDYTLHGIEYGHKVSPKKARKWLRKKFIETYHEMETLKHALKSISA